MRDRDREGESTPLIPKGSSGLDFGTTWIIFKCQVGSGILALPFAMLQGGYFAFFLIFIIGLCSTFSMYIACGLLFDERGVLIHKDVNSICRSVFSPLMLKFSFLMQALDIFLALVTFIVLGGTLLSAVFELTPFFGVLIFGCLSITLPFILRSTDAISKISFLGSLTIFLIYFIVLGQAIAFSDRWGENLADLPFISWDIFFAFGVMMFTFACHVSSPSYVAKMANPSGWRSVIFAAFTMGLVLQLTFGLIGVLAYGSETLESVNLNITFAKLSIIVSSALMLDKFVCFPILFQIWFEFVLKVYPVPVSRHGRLKAGVLFLILILALSIPHFAYVSSIGGCIACTFDVFIFPPLWWLKLKPRSHICMKALCVFTIVLGLVGGSIGLFVTLKALTV